MKGQTITALKQQRVFIQIQLHEQRALMLAQLCQQNHSAVEFPRSETMRFLSGKIGMNFIAEQTIG